METSPSELERLVRYCHPAKILATTRLPGTLDDGALAALYGVSCERYREVVEALRCPAIAALEGLALGDSHTDDLGSWAALLGLLNAGLSGDTTTAALARLHRLPAAERVYALLGTNDARRCDDGSMLVSHRATRRNLRAIDRALPQVTWITPPPVDEARIRADPASEGLTWRLADVAAKAAIVREELADVIDLWPGFRREHLAADGLHPSPAGQRLIAEAVLANWRSSQLSANDVSAAAGKR
jgi:lysophospholipase L1-like esterase